MSGNDLAAMMNGAADGLGVDAERELGHDHVAGERDLVDVTGLDASCVHTSSAAPASSRAGQVAEAIERLGIEHRRRVEVITSAPRAAGG